MAYTPEVKQKALALLPRKGVAETAEKLGISAVTLRKWRDQSAMPAAIEGETIEGQAIDTVRAFLMDAMQDADLAPGQDVRQSIAWLMGRASVPPRLV